MLDVLIAKFAQPMLYLVAVVAALTFYLDGMVIVATGAAHWLPLGMLVLSPLMMLLLRIGFEGSFDWSFFDPRVMSWSFVVGDVLLLPLALWFAGLGWQRVDLSGRTMLQAAACYIIAGLVVMIMFRKFDGDRYRAHNWASSLKSPTKVWHDCVVMPVVVALGMWLMAPQLFIEWSWYTSLAACCFGLFFVLNAVDAVSQPDPRRQHPLWDSKQFAPRSAI